MAILSVNHISKSFSTRVLFEDVHFEVEPRDKIGFVGVNGSGKSTLFRCLQGLESVDAGSIGKSRDLRIGSMEQTVPNIHEDLYTSTLHAFDRLMTMEQEIEEINERLASSSEDSLIRRQSSLRESYENQGGLTYRSRTRSMLLGLGFRPEELEKPLSSMSGGQRNKAQLARVLLSEANLLLLDEPTNHLDLEGLKFLEDFLCAYSGAFIVISHDRYFLDKVTTRTMELKNCRLQLTNGNYTKHTDVQSSEQESIRRLYMRTQKEIKRIEGIIEQQRRWNQARNYVTIASKEKQIERLKATLVAPDRKTDNIRFRFEARRNSGNEVLNVEGLAKSYDKAIFKNAEIHIRKGERVFLLGPNGCGKTTLLKILTGKERADCGSCRLGANVDVGYYEQHMDSLNEHNSILEELRDEYPKLTDTYLRTALGAFLFRGDDFEKPVAVLSGGERARVQLLKLMLSGQNFLLLDEPTNHLDISSREALEGALEDYEGTLLVVTHDRYLVNRLADRILYLEPDGISSYIGGYDDFLEAYEAKKSAQAQIVREEKPNDYKQAKQRQSAINQAKGEVRRAEERIARAEAELEALNEAMAEAGVDYQKAASISEKAAEKQAEIDSLYTLWEEAQEKLEALDE